MGVAAVLVWSGRIELLSMYMQTRAEWGDHPVSVTVRMSSLSLALPCGNDA